MLCEGFRMDRQQKWMDYLKPVVVGLVALMSAATFYLQRHDSGDVDTRVAALEVQMTANNKHDDTQDLHIEKFDGYFDNFRVLLSDVRSDVAFIRGKMEASK